MLAFLAGEDKKVGFVVIHNQEQESGELMCQASEELSWALEHCPAEPSRNIE